MSSAIKITNMVTYEVKDGVAIVTINNPPVNALHENVYMGLERSALKADQDASVRAVVLTGAGKSFVAGADIKAFGGLFNHTEDEVRTANMASNRKFDIIEEGSKPWVAAVNGTTFGGGLEFAMMCSHRVAVPTALLGLPELTLGLIPGLGGTQRLPRLIGVQNGVQAMLTSTQFPADKAQKLGLVDKVVQPADLLAEASRLALDIADGKVARQFNLSRGDRLENSLIAGRVLSTAEGMVKKRTPVMPQALACIRAIAAGVKTTGKEGRDVEAAEFAKLGKSPVSKALIHVFLAQRATSKVKGLGNIKPRTIKTAGVIGGGLMGSGIATCLITAGIRVLLKEINQEFLDAGVKRIQSNLQSQVKKGKLTQAKFDQLMSLVVPVLTYDNFKEVDIVIEAAVEKVDLKQSIFVELERVCRPDCILATNTSTIDIDLIAAKTQASNRVIGAHFFSPAHIMKLLEIVVGKNTEPQVIADLVALGGRIKKIAVVVGNCPGFAVNRTFFPYTMSASFLVEHGLDPYHIDEVIKAFGMPMGPFRLTDLVGIDVGALTSQTYHQHFGDRTFKSDFFKSLVDNNRLGEKSGKGIYKYDQNRKATQDPEFVKLLQASRAARNVPTLSGLSDKDIVEIIFFPVINEAARILDEGIIQKSSDLDIAALFGMGFPAHLGGPLHWGDQLTSKYVCERLEHFHKTLKHPLYKPCDYLVARAKAGQPITAKPAFTPSPDDIVIVSAARTAIGRAKKGGFNATPIDDLLKVVIRKVLDDAKPLKAEDIGDVVVGTVLGSMAATQARTAMLMAGMPYTVPVRTVNRQCSSGLQSIVDVAAAVKAGLYEVGLACGAESMSMNAMMPKEFKPNPNVLRSPEAASSYLPMGMTSENVAARFGVSRETQDRFAVESHARAAKAKAAGRLSHIIPVQTKMLDGEGKLVDVTVTQDEGVRPETTFESLSKLKPAFKPDGTTTAGNASQTSDGAAAVIVMKRSKALALGLKPLATLRSYHVAGCDPAIMGVGPAVAIPGAVDRAGLSLDEVEVYEINEAFASQATYCVDKLGLSYDKVNPNGGAIAIGHPLGMSGCRMTVDLIHELKRRNGGHGVVSMCIGTGMGAAAVFHVEP